MSKSASPILAPVSFQTTIHVRDHCLCLQAQRAARRLSRRFDEAMRPVGITSGQFSLLNGLNRPEPPPIGAIARLLAMDRSTVTANLKPLERMGAVRMVVDATDRRERRVLLTEVGRDLLARAMPIWTQEHEQIDAALGDQGGVLRSGLSAVIESEVVAA